MSGVFRKRNETGYANALICEAEGLESLREALRDAGVSGIRIPEVLSVGESEMEIEAIASRSPTAASLEELGEGLAQMHRLPKPQYGWASDNYIGLSPQPNHWSATWGEFFVRDRLEYQVSGIREPAIREKFSEVLRHHGERLADWLDEHSTHASLLHGDLWSGNVLFDAEHPWLIDPAVYCGDREADLAMTEMFGGFGRAFYQAYDRVYLRSSVYEQKRDIYNLYHYLNHYNLFGSGYLDGCKRGFSRLKRITESP